MAPVFGSRVSPWERRWLFVSALKGTMGLISGCRRRQSCTTFCRGAALYHTPRGPGCHASAPRGRLCFQLCLQDCPGPQHNFPGHRYSMAFHESRPFAHSERVRWEGQVGAVSAGGEADIVTRWLDRHSVTNE